MKNQVSTVRTSFSPTFLSIIRENHSLLSRLDRQRKMIQEKPAGKESTARLLLLEDKVARAELIVIVFSAMAIESYIYDYAARHLGDAFVKDHLERMDPLSKWILIPRLVTGRELPHRTHWQTPLASLIKVRNSIVHYKSSDPSAWVQDAGKFLKKLNAESDRIHETARQSIPLLQILADKIIEMDPEETPWVKSYLIQSVHIHPEEQ